MSISKYCFLLGFFLISCSGIKNTKPSHDNAISLAELKQQIDNILQDSALAQSQAGVKIVSLQTGKTLYGRDSEKLFHPASNMKLFSTAAALVKLGVNFKFNTQLLADSSAVHDSVVTGNLYLKGYGNPELNVADLRWLVTTLKKKGIRKITGDLICDDSFFDDYRKGSGWMWDDVSAWEYAPIGALNVSDNCVAIYVQPGAETGDSLRYDKEPPTDYMKINSTGVTVDSLDTLMLREFEVKRRWRPAQNVVDIRGGMVVGADVDTFEIDVDDGALFTGTLFAEILAEQGIQLAGKIKDGVAPDTINLLVEHHSPPLAEIIIRTNKISYNLSAEILLKTLAANLRRPPGTAVQGLSIVRRFLYEFELDTTAMRLADGSGVSRYNLVTPSQIVALLKRMHENFRVQAEFKASLPIAGVDGTLRKRMKDTPAEGKLRAKTGTLSGVSSLSGYTATAENEQLAFSMIMSHYVGSSWKIREVQDKIGALISGISLEY